MQAKTKHEWADYWAINGFYVFPCEPHGKRPLVVGGFKAATKSTAQIEDWWEAWPEANIGCCPDYSGHWVLDIDVKENVNGFETIWALELDNGEALPETFSVATPSGGQHLWFKGNADSTVRALGPCCDTRGRNGYVLLPGSATLAGSYTETRPLEQGISAAPAWLMARLAERESRNIAQLAPAGGVELDLPHNVERAQEWLKRAKPAIEGQGGNALTYSTACWLKDFGLSHVMTFALMWDAWNKRCDPPWDGSDLDAVVANAYEFGRNEPGSKAIPQNIYGDIPDEGWKPSKQEKEVKFKFKPRKEAEQDARKPPAWLVDGLIPEYGQCLLYGAPGSYKSFIALDIGLAVAADLPTLGLTCKQGSVLYIAGEGALGVEKVRRPAWRLARGIERELPFMVLDTMPFVGNTGDVDQLIKDLKAQEVQPRLIIVDTLARMAAGMDENSAKDMGVLLMQATKIQKAFHTTLLFIHHSGKDDTRGARGSSALLAGFDTVIYAKAHEGVKAVTLAVDKQKDAEPLAPICLQGTDFMGGLVFGMMDASEIKALAKSADAVTRQDVYQALSNLNAHSLDKGQKTKALAMEVLKVRGHGQEEDGYEKRLQACERSLRRLGGNRLSGYCTDLDGSRFWFITERED